MPALLPLLPQIDSHMSAHCCLPSSYTSVPHEQRLGAILVSWKAQSQVPHTQSLEWPLACTEKCTFTDGLVVPNGIVGRVHTRTAIFGSNLSVVPSGVCIEDIPFSIICGSPVYLVATPRVGLRTSSLRTTMTKFHTSSTLATTGALVENRASSLASKRGERRVLWILSMANNRL